MGSVVAALVTGVLTLARVLVSNSRSRAVMEVKIGNLARQVERHNCFIERTYASKRVIELEAVVTSLNILVGRPIKQALGRPTNELVQSNQAVDDVLFHILLLRRGKEI